MFCLESVAVYKCQRGWNAEEAGWSQRFISVELGWRTRAAGQVGQYGGAGWVSCVRLGRFSGLPRVEADSVWWSGEPAGCFLYTFRSSELYFHFVFYTLYETKEPKYITTKTVQNKQKCTIIQWQVYFIVERVKTEFLWKFGDSEKSRVAWRTNRSAAPSRLLRGWLLVVSL